MFGHLYSGLPAWTLAMLTLGLVTHIGAGGVAILSGAGAMVARKGGPIASAARNRVLPRHAFDGGSRLPPGRYGCGPRALGTDRQRLRVGFRDLPRVDRVADCPAQIRDRQFSRYRRVRRGSGDRRRSFVLAPALDAQPGDQRPWRPRCCADHPCHRRRGPWRPRHQGDPCGAASPARHASCAHLWRMCLGLFIATGSFFIGQQDDMPAFIQGSPILFILGFAPRGRHLPVGVRRAATS